MFHLMKSMTSLRCGLFTKEMKKMKNFLPGKFIQLLPIIFVPTLLDYVIGYHHQNQQVMKRYTLL